MKLIILCVLCLFATKSVFADDLAWAIAADAGKTTKNSKATRNAIKAMGVLDLILPGDNLYSSTYKDVWSPWSNEGFRFEVVAIGNHSAGYQKEMDFFEMPGEYFSKTYENRVRFIVLNSDNNKTAKEQAAFLEKELKSASEPFVFLVYHHPSYTLSHFHKWEEKKDFQLAIRPILKSYRSKITALLLGHDHLAMVSEFDNLPVIISGAVQEVRFDWPVNNTQDGVKVKTRWYFDNKPYWAKLTVPEEGSAASVEMLRAIDNVAKCSLSIETGKALTLGSNCSDN